MPNSSCTTRRTSPGLPPARSNPGSRSPTPAVDIDEHLYLDPPEWDLVNLGWDVQRRNRIGPAAYDRNNALLYVLELYADGAKPVVHVWKVTG